MNEEQRRINNICPKCKVGKLYTLDRGNCIEIYCQECDYQYIQQKESKPKARTARKPRTKKELTGSSMNVFKTYFKRLNSVSGILVVVLFFLMLALFAMADGQVRNAHLRIDYVESNIQNTIDKSITQMEENISIVESDITSIYDRLSETEIDITELFTLHDTVEEVGNQIVDMRATIVNINTNISSIRNATALLWFKVFGGTDQTNTNLTVVYFANQTGDTRYCHLNFDISKKDIKIEEIKFGIQYDKVDVSLLNWTGNIKPQEYQWLNVNHTDNYFLHWFGLNNNAMARYNITWDISDYNTSKISMANLKHTLMVNSVVLGIPEIWEEEVI